MITAPLAIDEYVRDELDDPGPYPGRLGEALFGQVSSPQYQPSVRGFLLDGSLRLVYAARLSHCRGCGLREQCQWHGGNTQKPRRVSVLLHPLQIGSAPLRWKDWNRRQHRRACMQLLRHQRVDVHLESLDLPAPTPSFPILSRAERAHARLAWEERLARNEAVSTAGRCTITLFGVPESFATSLGLLTA